jgi:ankyrin repeat protein
MIEIQENNVNEEEGILLQDPLEIREKNPSDGRSAIHIAAQGSSKAGEDLTEIVELLIESGASVHDTDKQGKTPLHLAISKCNRVIFIYYSEIPLRFKIAFIIVFLFF